MREGEHDSRHPLGKRLLDPTLFLPINKQAGQICPFSSLTPLLYFTSKQNLRPSQGLTLRLVPYKSFQTSSLKMYLSIGQVALGFTFSVTLLAALCCMQTMDCPYYGVEGARGVILLFTLFQCLTPTYAFKKNVTVKCFIRTSDFCARTSEWEMYLSCLKMLMSSLASHRSVLLTGVCGRPWGFEPVSWFEPVSLPCVLTAGHRDQPTAQLPHANRQHQQPLQLVGRVRQIRGYVHTHTHECSFYYGERNANALFPWHT